jgi:hypothetical protein
MLLEEILKNVEVALKLDSGWSVEEFGGHDRKTFRLP